MKGVIMQAPFWFVFLWLLLFSPAAFTKEAYWEERHIEVSGLTDAQLHLLESTIDQLGRLQPGELKIDKKAYRRLSRFKELFGFSLGDGHLSDWLLSRIRRVSFYNTGAPALNQNRGDFILGELFFTKTSPLERLYLLIHEARHSDGDGHDHIKCPKGFKFVSASQPELDLEHEFACDADREGAYAFQAAFLFELFAYGIFDQKETGLLYNSSISRTPP